MLEIDASIGEGGGQVLRTALALSIITQTPIHLKNIRAKRSKPGLMRQHLMCVQASQQISNAQVKGAHIGSSELEFLPNVVNAGEYIFEIGSAGSTSLVLQTILPPLLLAKQASTIQITGGTHNPLAPSATFLQECFLPQLAKMGASVEYSLERHGFYPVGGGAVKIAIQPVNTWQILDLTKRGEAKKHYAQALVMNLSNDICLRELALVQKQLNWQDDQLHHRSIRVAHGVGNVLELIVAHEWVTEVFTEIGSREKSAERVAKAASDAVKKYLVSEAPVGEYLADQLLLPCALAGKGRFVTNCLSLHFITNVEIIKKFLNIEIQTQRLDNGNFVVEVLS